MTVLKILAILGFLISLYAYNVERKLGKKGYKAGCDIRDNISCSKAFTSKYGKLVGIPNSLVGIFFYVIIFLLSYYNMTIIFYLAILAFLGSIYLAYISYFKLKNFCLVCSAVYLVNILLLIVSYLEL
ncbi:MAG: vitamin K epoxide reductase family protein [Nanoarchaeota archaeon]